ncbi:MAG: hypothetical protein BWY04_01076 [candidate division CPR1 bacterium ADurb.Bin160]|uniref:Uncharacterized protein n=1 Tax=candidate division CPR1 bacterium ADurb.Bin160 TaxID=1852826 RepID=A0A1V5ZLW5_9BACT|nr:MAG: hypothetical protein BWY04_01076 [candidate division CPR1 bacterium ADurb.Bin160]
MFDDSKDVVECQICKKQFKAITPRHLLKYHDMTIQEYREQFPDSPIRFQKDKNVEEESPLKEIENISKPEIEIFEEESPLKEIENISKPEIEIFEENFINENSVWEDIKKSKIKRVPIRPVVNNDNKNEIFMKLKIYFPNLENNYKIILKDKIHPHKNITIHEFILDMADPIEKIGFSFAKSFWGNPEPLGINRNKILEEYGWKIITIKQNVSDIHLVFMEILNKIKK